MSSEVQLSNEERDVYTSLYENDLFVDQIQEEFKCAICLCVLKEAHQLTTCGHMFCKLCVTNYFNSTNPKPTSCPIDRIPATVANVLPAPRAIRNVIDQFLAKCRYYEDGCTVQLPLSQLDIHGVICRFGPCSAIPQVPTTPADNVSVELSSLPMTIYVKLADTSKTAVISISATDDVMTLKRRIQEKEGLDVQSMILVHGAKPLAQDKRLLVDYNIKDGSVVFSTRRFEGGYYH